MLDRLEEGQRQLRAVNESLDLKIGELAETNVGLFESNRLKSEFLANVSHELRTPLNSIIGFAELLDEIARNDPNADPKRRRYITNILQSGRMLLDMINELLDMAKIEAGRMEVTVAPTSIADVVEGLQALMRPQAMARKIEVETQVEDGLRLRPRELEGVHERVARRVAVGGVADDARPVFVAFLRAGFIEAHGAALGGQRHNQLDPQFDRLLDGVVHAFPARNPLGQRDVERGLGG